MPIDILMPALSPTMEEGNLVKWLVKEGDSVASGDVLAEIETDKATMEVESIDEGVIGKIFVEAGTEGVKVNARIAVILEEGEDESAISSEAPEAKAPAEAEKEKEKEKPAPAKSEAAPASAPAQSKSGSESSGRRVFSSPLARRLAKEGGIDIAAIKGSGPRNRVIKRDVEEAIANGGTTAAAQTEPAAKTAAASSSAPSGMSDDAILKLYADDSYELVPHDGMRKTIAARLTEAKQTIPHFYLTIDCDLDALLAMRSQLNAAAPKDADGKPAYKISVNDMVIKAHALSLRAVPEANVSWSAGGMLKHKHSDIGVAVSIPGGLITPIITRAEEKTLSTISSEMKDLAKRARDRKLQPQEYQGGTSAVSNLGMFGVKDFAAIVNPPHGSILAVGAGTQRAVIKDGAVAAATIMSVTLSTDHRAVDGALGAELMQAFKGFIENPMSMLV
ncbi:pyruvate dehydrogenase complex dihydrolipoamide acetyltransferase [Pararhizobium sp. IMCC21322]|uniref:pyruvate dehydrogenase complex dihydrolipoamide acetyltransferase n=1 Tax=Pararhizobium sp. IMCC21322 TaxID=3067903 RepID=UPI0027405DE5|nr:pyruvate dehydrogenase complex dihydrolipoamide acetyltransferase [Pararhizobium sp. IMCC21322]